MLTRKGRIIFVLIFVPFTLLGGYLWDYLFDPPVGLWREYIFVAVGGGAVTYLLLWFISPKKKKN